MVKCVLVEMNSSQRIEFESLDYGEGLRKAAEKSGRSKWTLRWDAEVDPHGMIGHSRIYKSGAWFLHIYEVNNDN